MINPGRVLWLAVLSLVLIACSGVTQAAPAAGIRHYRAEIVATYPHDTQAFTQGLLFSEGVLFESTGRRGQSSVRKVDLASGRVEQKVALPARYFGEGSAVFKDRLYTLTWQSGRGFIFDPADLKLKGDFSYEGEGWGLTASPDELILSDGTASLRFLNPKTLKVTRQLEVRRDGARQANLNELEWVDGMIFANVWQSDEIVRIDPQTGLVTGIIAAGHLLPNAERRNADSVLNGIAWDEEGDRLFLTGKNWPSLFEVQLVEVSGEGG